MFEFQYLKQFHQGLLPDNGASYFLTKLEGRLGYYLALTGHKIKGEHIRFWSFQETYKFGSYFLFQY